MLTSDNIKNVFGIDAIVNKHTITKQLYVMALSKPKDQPDQNHNRTVHLICGGGTGSPS